MTPPRTPPGRTASDSPTTSLYAGGGGTPPVFATQSSLGAARSGQYGGEEGLAAPGSPAPGSAMGAAAESLRAGAPSASNASMSFTGRTQSMTRVRAPGWEGRMRSGLQLAVHAADCWQDICWKCAWIKPVRGWRGCNRSLGGFGR